MMPCWSARPTRRSTQQVALMREAMAEASGSCSSGFELRSDVRIVRWPDRYMDEKRGRRCGTP